MAELQDRAPHGIGEEANPPPVPQRPMDRNWYWLTAKAYRALGLPVPPEVTETDRALGLEP